MEFPCSCVDGYTPYATRYYLWNLTCTCSSFRIILELACRGVTGTTSDVVLVAMVLVLNAEHVGMRTCLALSWWPLERWDVSPLDDSSLHTG